MRVLLVDDDPAVRGALTHALSDSGFVVNPVGTAGDALRGAAEEAPDIIVLDLGLPDLDGSTALRMLRGVTEVPVIVATARSEERSIVALLNAGADDYVVKPFSAEHLIARISALLRRTARQDNHQEVLSVGGLRIDLRQHTAQLDGRQLELTRREFDLLAYLAARPGNVVSRRELFEAVWRQRAVGDDQTIDVHMSWLRRKLGETAANPRYLHTVRGVGVRLIEPAEAKGNADPPVDPDRPTVRAQRDPARGADSPR